MSERILYFREAQATGNNVMHNVFFLVCVCVCSAGAVVSHLMQY